MIRRAIGCMSGIVLGVSLAACSSGGDEAGKQSASLVVASVAEPVTLDPQLNDDNAGYPVYWRIYEGLYVSDAKRDSEPVLASGPAKQVQPTVWEVPLREGVKFSDGSPFDAKSAAFSINRIVDPKAPSNRAEIAGIKGAEVVDDFTISVTTEKPDFLLPRRLEAIMMLSDGNTDPNKKVIGTGPYKLESYDSSSQAKLNLNPSYRGSKPKITSVTVKFISEEKTRVQALQAGEADIALGIAPDQKDQVPQLVGTPLANNSGLIRLNTLNPDQITSDVRVREALNLAIDREALASSLYSGFAEPSQCQVGPKWVNGRDDDLKPVPYDPDRAKTLIEGAGATGKKITLQWPNNVYPQDRALGEAVAQAWTSIGLKVDLELQDFATFSKAIYTSGPDVVDGIFTELKSGLSHADRQMSRVWWADGVISSFKNDEVEKLRVDISAAKDDETRNAAYKKINEIGCDNYGVVFMLYRTDTIALRDGLDYEPRANNAFIVNYEDIGTN